jgi:hypothetical protein
MVSCKKDTFITDPNVSIRITADSVKFDTVFTSVGSITKSFKIVNENNQKLLVSAIKLMGGSQSNYRININGVSTIEEKDIAIDANDSIYVFVAITINPLSNNNPFIVSDSISISYNGNNKFVQLEAFGQNAHFIQNQKISGNTIWSNDLPYVILGNLYVDTTASLTIDPGCKIYFHANAEMIVDGQLQAIGTKNNEVQFNGDRLDEPYKNLPGSWPGIYFRNTSKNNQLVFAIIKNANRGITAEGLSTNNNPKLLLQQTIIDNALDAGLMCMNSSVLANNNLISNCGANINIQLGGNYSFTNCTVASYSNIYLLHKYPVLQIANYSLQNGTNNTSDISAMFTNCIFWGDGGNIDDEIIADKQGNNIFNVVFQNCLYKALSDPTNTTLNAPVKNLDPVFDSIDVYHNFYDFRTNKNITAPGIDLGVNTNFSLDLDNNSRQTGIATDLGCYEKQ